MSVVVPALPTVGEIARRLDEPLHRIEYVIRTRNIRPIGRAGCANIYSEADVSYIASELRRIDEERGGIAMIAPRNPIPPAQSSAPSLRLLLLRPQEAANSLGVSLRSLMAWAATGEVPVVRLGDRCLPFSVADLEAWIAARSTRRPAKAIATDTSEGGPEA